MNSTDDTINDEQMARNLCAQWEREDRARELTIQADMAFAKQLQDTPIFKKAPVNRPLFKSESHIQYPLCVKQEPSKSNTPHQNSFMKQAESSTSSKRQYQEISGKSTDVVDLFKKPFTSHAIESKSLSQESMHPFMTNVKTERYLDAGPSHTVSKTEFNKNGDSPSNSSITFHKNRNEFNTYFIHDAIVLDADFDMEQQDDHARSVKQIS